eukprot:3024328-Rhodomonas_salina.1
MGGLQGGGSSSHDTIAVYPPTRLRYGVRLQCWKLRSLLHNRCSELCSVQCGDMLSSVERGTEAGDAVRSAGLRSDVL